MKKIFALLIPSLVLIGLVWRMALPYDHAFLPTWSYIIAIFSSVPNGLEPFANAVNELNSYWGSLNNLFAGGFDMVTFFSQWLPRFFGIFNQVWNVIVAAIAIPLNYLVAFFYIIFNPINL